MGLDQNAIAISNTDIHLLDSQEYLDGEMAIESEEELMYWRKHANLEGWMAELYRAKGGQGTFNCERVYLRKEELLELRKLVKADGLEHATGFFWGVSQPEHKKDTLEFIKKALDAIKRGKTVYYTSSW